MEGQESTTGPLGTALRPDMSFVHDDRLDVNHIALFYVLTSS